MHSWLGCKGKDKDPRGDASQRESSGSGDQVERATEVILGDGGPLLQIYQSVEEAIFARMCSRLFCKIGQQGCIPQHGGGSGSAFRKLQVLVKRIKLVTVYNEIMS